MNFPQLFVSVIFVFWAVQPIRGQAPPAVDLSGTWTLDATLSDNPEQVAAAVRIDLAQGGTGTDLFGGGPGGRYGRGGMGRGRAPGGGAQGGNERNQTSLEDQNRLDELTAAVRYPPSTLVISQTSTSIAFTDAQGQTRTFTTNDKREKQTIGTSTIETTTRWEGPRLVSEQDLGRGRKTIFTYSIVPTTKQLLVRVGFERGPGQRGPFEVKLVYNRSAS